MSGMRWMLVMAIGGVGCTHAVHVNHTSDFQTTKALSAYRVIDARAEQHVVLGFVGDTHYANDAYLRLMNQCEGGQVTGIQTRYSTSHSFFSWTNVVEMKGYCSK